MLIFILLLTTCSDILATAKLEDYGKLVDGELADIASFPYQVAILFNEKLTCGGSIIDKKWILTAAHCTINRPKELFLVRAGSSSPISDGTVYKVANTYEHPNFSLETIDYDIALMELAEQLEYDYKIRPIQLAYTEPASRSLAVVTGWGIPAETFPFTSPILRSVEVPIVSRLVCNLRYFFKVSNHMICAGYTFGGKNICKGDSGGPLVYQGKQIGIVSWAAGCARPISPGVFTSVPSLLDFIRGITKLSFRHN